VKGSSAVPNIAVVVPNRNDSRYLRVCLQSLLSQEVKPDELIVVDDQSTDDSVQVIRSLLAEVSFARLVENPVNLGTYGALYEGFKRSRSDYVLFLASNDYVLPGIFARAKAALARSPQAGLWSALAWLVDDDGRPIRLHNSPVVALRDAYFSPEECRRMARRFGNWFTGPTLTYHREVLEEVGFFDPAYGGLADLISALAVAARRGAAYSPAPLASIRVHAQGNLSRTLGDPVALDGVISRLVQRGPELAPELFTPDFLKRTTRRFRFASVRASSQRLQGIAERMDGWQGRALRAVAWVTPARARRVRIVFAFAILRPFDLLPTLWYRIFAWLLIRMRQSAE
jgi:hypothetical protein